MSDPLLRFLGTGTAFHTDGRLSQALLCEPGASPPFLVDAGPTLLSALHRFAVDPAGIDRLFVTHLHGDHTAGWPFLLLQLVFVERRTRPFDIFGPAGVRERLEALSRLCYGELAEPGRVAFELRYHELVVGEAAGVAAGDGIRFNVLPMDHHESSIGFRFHLGERTLAVTGDTRWCPNLERLASETETLVTECTTLEPGAAAHLSLAEIRAGIARLGSGQIALTHLPDEVAAALAIDPLPRVVAAYDGMTLPLS